MLTMKPHHFVDMIKLHGAGYDIFVPDEATGHSFYRIGNMILKDPETTFLFTQDCDDVCSTCRHRKENVCMDGVTGQGDFQSKDTFNKLIDARLIRYLDLQMDRPYTAREYCMLLAQNKEVIFKVWDLEEKAITDKRYRCFCAGCDKYLKNI